MKKINIPINILMTILCLAFLLCFSISAVVWFRPIYYLDINALNIPTLSGVSAEICKRNYDVLIDYNLIWGPVSLAFPDFIMSEHGSIHFSEVKNIFVAVQWTALIGGILMIPACIFTHRKKIYGWLRATVITAFIIIFAVVTYISIDWNGAFVFLHHMLFSNDYWLFDPVTDPVINILPDAFFEHCLIGIVLLFAIGLILCEVFYRKRKNQIKKTL